jgi:hypothetical protein
LVPTDIERQSERPPAKTGNILETIARGIFLATAGISAGLGVIHLWRVAFPKHPAPRRPVPPPPDDPTLEPEQESFEHPRRHERKHAREHACQARGR